jgi:3-isopropylmalate dehydrogenase
VTVRVLVLPGDGIGPEVTRAAVRVFERAAALAGHTVTLSERSIGGVALAAGDKPLPSSTLEAALDSDAVLLGAVGDPRFDGRPPSERPESALLALRAAMGVFANLRPALAWPALVDAGPLKPDVLAGTDLVVVRELTGGLYYGHPRGMSEDGLSAVNTLTYTRDEVVRVARRAFNLARHRRQRVVSVDKANVLEVSRLWRRTVTELALEYPDVELSHEYVDAAAMKLVLAPASFDVMLTENMFGDILSDQAGAVCGSLGLLPSASLGEGPALYEPVHGSAPTLAGKDVANPIGAIASVAMLVEHTLGDKDLAARIMSAIGAALADGYRTPDIAQPGQAPCGTAAMAGAILERL